jgi:hypothetical protein
MSVKVKRGLGLLVVAVAAWIVAAITGAASTDNAVVSLLGALAVVVLIVCAAAGLALVAWGLLRD